MFYDFRDGGLKRAKPKDELKRIQQSQYSNTLLDLQDCIVNEKQHEEVDEKGDASVVNERGDANVVNERGDVNVVNERGDASVVNERGDANVVNERGDANVAGLTESVIDTDPSEKTSDKKVLKSIENTNEANRVKDKHV